MASETRVWVDPVSINAFTFNPRTVRRTLGRPQVVRRALQLCPTRPLNWVEALLSFPGSCSCDWGSRTTNGRCHNSTVWMEGQPDSPFPGGWAAYSEYIWSAVWERVHSEQEGVQWEL